MEPNTNTDATGNQQAGDATAESQANSDNIDPKASAVEAIEEVQNTQNTEQDNTAIQEKKEEPKKERFSAELNKIKKYDQQRREENRRLKEELTSIRQQLTDATSQERLTKTDISEKLSKNPVEFLSGLGLSNDQISALYNAYTEAAINDWKPVKQNVLEKEVSELKKFKEEQLRLQQEKEEEKKKSELESYHKNVVSTFKTTLKDVISKNADSYPLSTIDEEYTAELAMNIVSQYESRKIDLPSWNQLNQLVEEILESELENTEKQLLEAKSVKQKRNPKSSDESRKVVQSKPVPNNRMAGNFGRAVIEKEDDSNIEVRRQRAQKALLESLNN